MDRSISTIFFDQYSPRNVAALPDAEASETGPLNTIGLLEDEIPVSGEDRSATTDEKSEDCPSNRC